jgi:hypothetical protein
MQLVNAGGGAMPYPLHRHHGAGTHETLWTCTKWNIWRIFAQNAIDMAHLSAQGVGAFGSGAGSTFGGWLGRMRQG